MTNFDNVVVAEQFAGKKLGQLIAKKEYAKRTIWVYEGSVIRSEIKKNGKVEDFAWHLCEGQEMFALKNRMKPVDGYIETVRMQLAKEYMAEVAKVYADGFKSILHDRQNGIVRDYSKVNSILAELGANYRLGPVN